MLPQALFRSGEDDVMQRFIELGEIRFRPLTYYRQIDDKRRRDVFEGTVQRDAGRGILSIQDPETQTWERVATLGKTRVSVSLKEAQNCYISCFSVSSRTTFGNSKIKIGDVRLWLDIMAETLTLAGLKLQAGRVTYYSFNENVLTNNKIEKPLWLHKADTYSAEREFRIGVSVDRLSWMTQALGRQIAPPSSLSEGHITIRFGDMSAFAATLS